MKVENCGTSPEPCSAAYSGTAGASREGFLQEAGRDFSVPRGAESLIHRDIKAIS